MDRRQFIQQPVLGREMFQELVSVILALLS
jgi:hypothetical protein